MDLTSEAINTIVGLGALEQVEKDGISYSTKKLYSIMPPLAESLTVSTLTAIVEYLQKNPDSLNLDKTVVQVASHNVVKVISTVHGTNRTRENMLKAVTEPKAFPFGRYMPQEDFLIALQTYFKVDQQDSMAAVLKSAGNTTTDASAKYEDDGVTQVVSARAGVALMAANGAKLPNPVTLTPYRTFNEVQQPSSQFVFRVKMDKQGGPPEMALYEADGGNWQLDAIEKIKTWLEAELPKNVVILA